MPGLGLGREGSGQEGRWHAHELVARLVEQVSGAWLAVSCAVMS